MDNEKHRLNVQVGTLMQHHTFPNYELAMTALRDLLVAKAAKRDVAQISATAFVDPTTVSFAEVRRL
jgi:hypothetical protein